MRGDKRIAQYARHEVTARHNRRPPHTPADGRATKDTMTCDDLGHALSIGNFLQAKEMPTEFRAEDLEPRSGSPQRNAPRVPTDDRSIPSRDHSDTMVR